MKINLSTRLIISTAISGLIPLIALALYGLNSADKIAKNAQKELLSISEFAIESIERNLFERYGDVQAFALNSVLQDFPMYRLEFLEIISKKSRVFLLSNTDSIHINYFKERNGADFYDRFYNCFEKVYFSYDLGKRKPDVEIYQLVIDENQLNPENTLFVDDNLDNTEGAKRAGLPVWHLQKGKEDVIDLFEKSFWK
jgi:FMN phosphatase YigB (HAD superfamily)